MSQSTPHLEEVELLDLADGVPTPALRERAELHLDACDACRRALADFLRLRAAPAPDVHAARTELQVSESPGAHRALSGMPVLTQGTLLGRYVVLERLGSGGMGVVHAAYDPSLDRRIGLKLLRALPTEGGAGAMTERLLREAQAAARTRHPHVVTVHDVGTFGELVFIAMELVDGGNLRQHLRDAPRPWSDVVRLYVQAGRGLAAAHAAGVVHRDFKPDNVLVDKEGRARVTDFGLARLESAPPLPGPPGGARTGPDGGVDTADPALRSSVATAVAGTPGYIAPEVFAGAPADARSDQYAFCVSLYEGLHGQRPPPPDAGGPVNRSGVPRAVHALVARGLSPDPAARHPSMPALLDALERAAFPRVRRRTVAAVGLAVGLLALGVAVVARGPSPCADDPARLQGVWDAERKAALLKAFGATGAPAASAAYEVTARALDAYAANWHASRRDACRATHGQGTQSAAVMDLRMNCLERRRRELSSLTDVLLAADRVGVASAPEAALALSPLSRCADVEALSQPVPPPERPETAARVQAAYAKLDDARARLGADRWQEAVDHVAPIVAEAEQLGYKPLLGEALLIEGEARAFLRDEAAAPALRRAQLASLAGRDDLHATEAVVFQVFVDGEVAQRPEQARAHSDEARALLERSGGNVELESQLLAYEGNSLAQQARTTEALAVLQQALALQERLHGKDSPRLARALIAMGSVQRMMGRNAEALATVQRARSVLEAAYGPDHPKVAIALNNLGGNLVEMQRYEEGREAFLESLRRYERIHGDNPPLRYVSGLKANLGAVAFRMGRYEEAERRMREVLAIYEKLYPRGSVFRIRAGGNLALVLMNQSRMTEAQALLKQMEEEVQVARADGRSDPVFSLIAINQSEGYLRLGQPERAVEAARRGVNALREMHAEAELVDALRPLAVALARAHHPAEAGDAAREALTLHRKLAGEGARPPLELEEMLGEVALERGELDDAIGWTEASLEAWTRAGAPSLELANARFILARALRRAHREPERARALATAARDALLPTAPPRMVSLEALDAFLRER